MKGQQKDSETQCASGSGGSLRHLPKQSPHLFSLDPARRRRARRWRRRAQSPRRRGPARRRRRRRRRRRWPSSTSMRRRTTTSLSRRCDAHAPRPPVLMPQHMSEHMYQSRKRRPLFLEDATHANKRLCLCRSIYQSACIRARNRSERVCQSQIPTPLRLCPAGRDHHGYGPEPGGVVDRGVDGRLEIRSKSPRAAPPLHTHTRTRTRTRTHTPTPMHTSLWSLADGGVCVCGVCGWGGERGDLPGFHCLSLNVLVCFHCLSLCVFTAFPCVFTACPCVFTACPCVFSLPGIFPSNYVKIK